MISVITITYNNFNELISTLNSLPNADFIESIVINGGNEIESFNYLKTYSGIVVNEKDNGIADAFNKGIQKSSGDAIMFLNSGDILIRPEYLIEAEKILQSFHDVSFVHSNIIFNDSIAGEIFMRPQLKSFGRGLPFLHPTMIVRKSVFNKIGMFNTNFKISMDFDFALKLNKNGFIGYYLNGPAVIKMDGRGKSAEKEFTAIIECYKSLKENDCLNLKNKAGFLIRLTLFLARKFMLMIGWFKMLKKIKRLKHSA
jgi:glycosyltransferase